MGQTESRQSTRQDLSKDFCFELFLGSYLFDSNCYHRSADLPLDVIQVICTILPNVLRRFSFTGPFDQMGVLSWLREKSYKVEFPHTNIIPHRIIDLMTKEDHPELIPGRNDDTDWTYFYSTTAKSFHIKQERSIEILGQQLNAGSFVCSNAPNYKYFIIDLQKFKLFLTHMTISCFEFSPRITLKSIEFYGSNDRKTWNLLPFDSFEPSMDVIVDRELARTWSFHVQELISRAKSHEGDNSPGYCHPDYYRYYKIQKGPVDSKFPSLQDVMIISGLELYGFVK